MKEKDYNEIIDKINNDINMLRKNRITNDREYF